MNKPRSLLAAAAAAAGAALLLAACGGSDNDATPPDDPAAVPESAASSTSAWFKFATSLMASDTAEPLSLDKISTLPLSESEEPTPLGA
jgi:hypothetical protein